MPGKFQTFSIHSSLNDLAINAAAGAIDGNPSTIYHSHCGPNVNGMDLSVAWCWFQIDFKYEWNIAGFQVDVRAASKNRFNNIEVMAL